MESTGGKLMSVFGGFQRGILYYELLQSGQNYYCTKLMVHWHRKDLFSG